MDELKPCPHEHTSTSHTGDGAEVTTCLDCGRPIRIERIPEAKTMQGDYAGLVEQLREGVKSEGLHVDNETELFDIAGADEVMFEAAAAIEALTRPAPDSVALVKAGLEAAAKVMDGRVALYQAKAERHNPTADDELTYHESKILCAEASEWGAAEIRRIDPAAIAATVEN